MSSPAPAFGWSSLLNNVSALGGSILGNSLLPNPANVNAQTGAQSNAFNQQLTLNQLANRNQTRQNILPGMYQTLGYNPSQSTAMAAGYGNAPNAPLPTASTSTGAPLGTGLGSTLAGAGLAVGPAIAGGLIKGGAAAGAAGAAGAAAGGLGGGAVGLGGIGASVEGGSVAGALAPGAADATAAAAGGTAAGGGGIGATLGALATNPITWLAAGGLVAGLLWKQSQVHPTADKWVQGEQNPFDTSMKNLDTAVSSGQMTPQQAQAAKQTNVQNYLSALQNFATQGSHENIVAKQALQTFQQYYGSPASYGVQVNI